MDAAVDLHYLNVIVSEKSMYFTDLLFVFLAERICLSKKKDLFIQEVENIIYQYFVLRPQNKLCYSHFYPRKYKIRGLVHPINTLVTSLR